MITFHRCDLWTWSYLNIYAQHILTSLYILTIDSIILPLYVQHLLLPLIWICKLPKFGRAINPIAESYGSWGGSSVKQKHPISHVEILVNSDHGIFIGSQVKKKHKHTQRLSDATKHVFNWKEKTFLLWNKTFFAASLFQVKKINNFSSPCFQKRVFLLVPTNTHDQKPVSPMLLRPTLRSCSMRAP